MVVVFLLLSRVLWLPVNCPPPDVEAIVVKITLNQLQIVVCNCYIPPNSGDLYLDTLLTFLSNLISDRVIIAGDFNFPDINWSFLTGYSSSSNSFCDFVFDNNLVQLVDSPTHVGGNVLDLVLTTDDQLIEDLYVGKPNQLFCSDHHMITFNYSHRSSPHNSQQLLRGNSTHFVFFPKADTEGLRSTSRLLISVSVFSQVTSLQSGLP